MQLCEVTSFIYMFL